METTFLAGVTSQQIGKGKHSVTSSGVLAAALSLYLQFAGVNCRRAGINSVELTNEEHR